VENGAEVFVLGVEKEVARDIAFVDVRPDIRHLMIHADGGKFLCGMDERHWFVCGVDRTARNIDHARDLLKPFGREVEIQSGVRHRDRFKRRTKAFVRQGEWFFLPRPGLNPDPALVRRREPLRRTFSNKPHWVDELYREPGRTVMISRDGNQVVEVSDLSPSQIVSAKARGFREQQLVTVAYVRGAVRHPDHKTIHLKFWHQVMLNRELENFGAVAFLD